MEIREGAEDDERRLGETAGLGQYWPKQLPNPGSLWNLPYSKEGERIRSPIGAFENTNLRKLARKKFWLREIQKDRIQRQCRKRGSVRGARKEQEAEKLREVEQSERVKERKSWMCMNLATSSTAKGRIRVKAGRP